MKILGSLVLWFFISVAFQASGQTMSRHGLSGGIDVGFAFKKGSTNPSLTYYELTSLAKSKSFFVGWTARLSSFYGNDLDYYTAPARLTRGQSGLGSLFQPLLPQNVDTIRFDQVAHTSFNLGARAEWYVGRFEFGASVDLLGITLFRKSRIGIIHSSTGRFATTDSSGRTRLNPFQGADIYQSAIPHRINFRLLGDNDYGMLTTEVYARFRIRRGLSLKAGYQLVSTEMVISNPDRIADNDRFRNRADLFYLGLTVPINPW